MKNLLTKIVVRRDETLLGCSSSLGHFLSTNNKMDICKIDHNELFFGIYST